MESSTGTETGKPDASVLPVFARIADLRGRAKELERMGCHALADLAREKALHLEVSILSKSWSKASAAP